MIKKIIILICYTIVCGLGVMFLAAIASFVGLIFQNESVPSAGGELVAKVLIVIIIVGSLSGYILGIVLLAKHWKKEKIERAALSEQELQTVRKSDNLWLLSLIPILIIAFFLYGRIKTNLQNKADREAYGVSYYDDKELGIKFDYCENWSSGWLPKSNEDISHTRFGEFEKTDNVALETKKKTSKTLAALENQIADNSKNGVTNLEIASFPAQSWQENQAESHLRTYTSIIADDKIFIFYNINPSSDSKDECYNRILETVQIK